MRLPNGLSGELRMSETTPLSASQASQSSNSHSSASGSAGGPATPSENIPVAGGVRATLLDSPQQTAAAPSRIQMWMHRISVFLFVLISAVAGVLLIILPWTPEWTDNRLLSIFPGLRSVINNGFVRGLCSGLGLLDIWIGFWEALHYHEQQ
jgi:hypothetical protein